MAAQDPNALPPGAVIYAQPLNVGAQPFIVDRTADTSQMQVPVITPDGAIGMMNFGAYVSKIVSALAADKSSVADLANAIASSDSALNALKEAVDKAIQELNDEIAGSGNSLKDVIAALGVRVSALESRTTALDGHIDTVDGNLSQFMAVANQHMQGLDIRCDNLQAQINALPKGK